MIGHWKFLCLCLNFFFINSTTLGVEAWAAIGLIGGIVAIIIGLIWIVFCIMLYRHYKERRGSDEDSNKVIITSC
jgi:fatty acid desaturase